MRRKGSRIATYIDQEYKINKRFKEKADFNDQYCVNCLNKETNLCEIRRTIDGELRCIYFKEKKHDS